MELFQLRKTFDVCICHRSIAYHDRTLSVHLDVHPFQHKKVLDKATSCKSSSSSSTAQGQVGQFFRPSERSVSFHLQHDINISLAKRIATSMQRSTGVVEDE